MHRTSLLLLFHKLYKYYIIRYLLSSSYLENEAAYINVYYKFISVLLIRLTPLFFVFFHELFHKHI